MMPFLSSSLSLPLRREPPLLFGSCYRVGAPGPAKSPGFRGHHTNSRCSRPRGPARRCSGRPSAGCARNPIADCGLRILLIPARMQCSRPAGDQAIIAGEIILMPCVPKVLAANVQRRCLRRGTGKMPVGRMGRMPMPRSHTRSERVPVERHVPGPVVLPAVRARRPVAGPAGCAVAALYQAGAWTGNRLARPRGDEGSSG